MQRTKAFFYIALLVLYTSWLPVKSISYLVPLVAIGIYIIYVPKKNIFSYLVGYFTFFLIVSLIHFFLESQFVWSNAFLSIVTYSSFIFLFIIKPSPYRIKKLYNDILPHVRVMILIQALLGIIQAIYGASITGSFDLDTGDFVEGTIHPALMSERSFSNPIFAVNIFFLIIYLIPSLREKENRKSLLGIFLGICALILSSVVHLLLFIFVAAVIAFLILDLKKLTQGKYFKYLMVVVGIPLLLFFSQPKNFSLIGKYAIKIAGGELPKATVTLRTFITMPKEYPYAPIIGLGPGQYTSRASLIGSGRYIGGDFSNPTPVLPFSDPQMSIAFKEYVFDLWKLSRDFEAYGGGATAKPFYSWLALYSEFGFLFLLIGIYMLHKLFKRIKKLRRDNEKQLMVYLITIGSGVLILLGFMENYWEVPQAILWGLVTLILFYNMTKSQYNLLLIKKKIVDEHSSSS